MNEQQLKILEVAKYIIKNKATIEVTANHFGLSESSIKKYINKKLPEIDINIYNDVKEVQKYLTKVGQIIGGETGKRYPNTTKFEDQEIAEVIIEQGLTLKEASNYFNMQTSTIYERIMSVEDENIKRELKNLFEGRKLGS